jgi:hypothetical protein
MDGIEPNCLEGIRVLDLTTDRRFPVPVGIVSRHTANAILSQAGLPKAF